MCFTRTPVWMALVAVAALACDDDDDAVNLDAGGPDATLDASDTPDAGDATPGDADPIDTGPVDLGPGGATLTIEWAPCVGFGAGAQCADVEVPGDWDDPESPTLTVRVTRVPASPSTGDVWLLAGGPGQSGGDLAMGAPFYSALAGGADVYLLDFRGTGASSRLDCGDDDLYEPASRAHCVASLTAAAGDRLPHYTVTGAARDLGELIEATRDEAEPVFVIGGSFGTYWAHRYLQLYPDQPDAVVLDSLCPPGTCDYSRFQDAAANDVTHAFFDLCAADPTCDARLGGDPWGFVDALFARFEDGDPCPDLGADAISLRNYIAGVLMNVDARQVLPALLYRFDRCDPEDVAAIEHFDQQLYGGIGGDVGGWSTPLRFHVATSELLPDPPPTVAELEALHQTLRGCASESVVLAEAAETWPRYPRDALVDQRADTDVPILMLNGTLDPGTSPAVAEGFLSVFDGAHQHLVLLDYLSHGTLGSACAQTLTRAFFADPTAAPDLACLGELTAPDLSPDAATAQRWFGVDDAWGDPAE